jgi:hypothetical protein
MTTSLEQIIQFLNNLSYITYVGIQYWEKIVRMQSYCTYVGIQYWGKSCEGNKGNNRGY